jgi:hypothetical protein
MVSNHRSTRTKLAQIAATVAFAAALSSCGHSEASPSPPVPSVDIAMQTVRDYGRGHAESVVPPPTPIPQEQDVDYRVNLEHMILESKFEELEKIARENRAERGLLQGGIWKDFSFHDVLANPGKDAPPTEIDYQNRFKIMNQWINAYPESVSARIVLARLYTNYANFARGGGLADTVSDSQWKLYKDRTALAEQTLIDAARLKDRDPHWYQAMQQVAFNQGWDKENALELLHQAVAFEPSYYNYYREYGDFLKTQWYGQPGEITQFAEKASLELKDPDASILYFRIASSLACNCEPQIADIPGIDWPKFKSGYSDVTHLYGFSNLNANRLAFVAYKLGDKATAQQAFSTIDHMEMDVWWGPHTFANARDWANSPQ